MCGPSLARSKAVEAARGQQQSLTAPGGLPGKAARQWTFSCKAAGDLVEQPDPLGDAQMIVPDAVGRSAGFTNPLGFGGSSEYTPVDAPSATVDLLGGRASVACDAAGRRIAMGASFARVALPPPLAAATCDATNHLVNRAGTSSPANTPAPPSSIPGRANS